MAAPPSRPATKLLQTCSILSVPVVEALAHAGDELEPDEVHLGSTWMRLRPTRHERTSSHWEITARSCHERTPTGDRRQRASHPHLLPLATMPPPRRAVRGAPPGSRPAGLDGDRASRSSRVAPGSRVTRPPYERS